MGTLKDWKKGIFFVNGEPSRTSLFLFTFFIIAVVGLLRVIFFNVELTTNMKDLLEFIIAMVILGKVSDTTIDRMFNSPSPPIKKNPTGGEGGV